MKKTLFSKTFMRYCVSYLLVLVLPIIVVAASFNTRFIASYRQTLIEQLQLTAEKTMTDLERQLAQMNMIALQFSFDGDYSAARLQKDQLLFRAIREQLTHYVGISPFLSDIAYINCGYPQRYYTIHGTYNAQYFNQYRIEDHSVSALEYCAALQGRHWIARAEVGSRVPLHRQSIEYACPVTSVEDGWLLFYLPATLMERMLNLSAIQLHITGVLNKEGAVLLGEEAALAPWREAVAAQHAASQGLVKLPEGDYALTINSATLGLTCVYTIAADALLSQVNRLSRQFLVLLLIMLMAGCALAVYLSRSMARPIDALVRTARRMVDTDSPTASSEIGVVRDALESVHRENVQLHSRHLRMERQNVLMRLMGGQYSRRAELEADCAGIDIPMIDSVYVAALIDELSMPTAEMEQEIALLFDRAVLVYGFRFREQGCQVFLLIGQAQEGKSQAFREMLFEKLIRRYPGVMLVLGGAAEDLLLVQQSYQDAVFAKRISQMRGLSAPVMSGSEHTPGDGLMYPKQEIEALHAILCQKDVEKLGFIQDTLLYTLRRLGEDPVFQQALCYDIISTYNLALAKLGIGGRSERQPFVHYDRHSLHLDRLLEIIQGLYVEAVDAFIAAETPVLGEEMNRILAYIDAHREGVLGVGEVAERFGLTPSNLSHQFKRATGETLSNYIAAHKLTLAKELLRSTDLDVAEIGERLGYNHSSSFIRMFHKAEGVTPMQYREDNRESA